MTTPTNWPNPERPGVPMFPERDGWHAIGLTIKQVKWWDATNKYWWDSEKRYYLTLDEVAFRVPEYRYDGPVLTPAQIAEMLAAERRSCVKLVKKEVTNLVGDKRQFLKKAHLRFVLKSIIQEIRNLGAAP
ncbi:hypothetical protein [Acetobacter okinawensis]|uniref:hypothetical protein n=1 Tax=Acetobacter okinawensis TaxID=1076594 RepID=UPI0004714B3A|nr:hypothetical protein [Acetobacter okinawensis]